MWNVLGSGSSRLCDRRSRRDVLRVGVLTGAGLGLADLLRLRAAAAPAESTPPRSVIHIFLGGGPSHFETFDPKPDAPADIRGPYSPIATSNPALSICETLPRLARVAHLYSVVRSCCHDNPGHGGGHRYVTTGYKSASLEFELPHDYPGMGCVVSRVRGAMHQGMPNLLQMGTDNDCLPAFLGPACGPFNVYSTGKPVGLEIHPAIKLTRLDDRRSLKRSFDHLQRTGETRLVMDGMDELEQQAYEMLSSTRAHDAFDIRKEPASILERYGDHAFSKMALLARRFVQAGAGFVSIRMGSWDHHGNAGGTVTSGMKENAPPMDRAVATLLEDLHEQGLLETTLVLLWGEFGRTPRINSSQGRDHWPQAMSVLLAGGGLQAGRVIGATNRKGEFPIDRAVSPADILATVYRQIGIDPERQFLNGAGRPVSILSHGAAILELI